MDTVLSVNVLSEMSNTDVWAIIAPPIKAWFLAMLDLVIMRAFMGHHECTGHKSKIIVE